MKERAWAQPDRRAPEFYRGGVAGKSLRIVQNAHSAEIRLNGWRALISVFVLGLLIGVGLGAVARALGVPGFVIDIPVEIPRPESPQLPSQQGVGSRVVSGLTGSGLGTRLVFCGGHFRQRALAAVSLPTPAVKVCGRTLGLQERGA